MKQTRIFITIAFALLVTFASFGQTNAKLVSSKTHVKFFSTTPAEDIEAHNYASVSTINKETGDVVFSVPMQGFEFEIAVMQKHYNSSKFLDTKTYPKAKFKAKIMNLDQIDFSKDGTYTAIFEGNMTIKGVTNPISEKGTIKVKGNILEGNSKFDIILSDYGISFVKGKPSSNIAKTLEITVQAEYQTKKMLP